MCSAADNIAPLATVTASSENVSGDQTAIKTVDGVAEGYPSNRTAEWRTKGQKVGAWLNLVWSSAHTIDRVVLYDRPNLNDQITSATLSFSDGSSVSVGTLNNDGTGVTVSFPARTVTSLTLTVTGVSGTTTNIGLAEIEVYEVSAGGNQPPTANAGADQTVAQGALVQLDGTGSTDPEASLLTYQWTQTAGPSVGLSDTASATPSFTAPAVGNTTVFTFQLVVNDGALNSAPDAVNVTVQSAQTGSNIAPLATVTASSENVSGDQTAIKTVDGVAEGYPSNRTAEWRTKGQKVGAWLNLVWSSAHTIDRVVLYDRPNLNDQITSATLSFSDGSSVSVGTLNNDGTGVTVSFPARTVTSLTLTVTGVSGTTTNIGLAEIEVYEVSAGGNQPPTANAGADQSVDEGMTVNLPGSGTDPDGTIASYSWIQTVGPTVTLSNANTAMAGFTAPLVSANTLLTFQLTVTDNQGGTDTDTVNVTVNDMPVGNQPPTANAGADQTVAQGALVQLDGTGSTDPEASLLTYQWTQTAGPSVGLSDTASATPSFTAPAVGSTTVFTFQLVVNDGALNSAPDAVNVTVQSAQTGSNIAPLATVTASSENVSGDQTAIKTVDGVAEGYPSNRTAEWRTKGQKVGAWLNLVWSSAHTIDRVVLYDRPNLNDQITSATLSFSDGSSVSVGTLNNDGTGVTVSFPARTVTSLTLTVTGVSGTTTNIGLAEIEVYEVSAGAPVANNACAYTPMNTPVSGALSATDPEGQALTYSLATQGGKGSVNLDSAGNYSYTPNNPDFRGLDMFTYNVTDTEGNTSTGSVWVIIDGVIRFMPLGDSITAGSFSLPSLPFSEQVGYRRKLFLDLEDLSPNYGIDFVGSNSNGSTDHDKDNEGHGGGCATGPCGIFEVIDTNIVGWLNANPADIVLLHIGINDINQRGDTSATGVTNILNAIDTWEAANHPVTVLLAKIIDDVPNYQTELNVTTYNNNLASMLAGRLNDRVILVDMRDGAGILYGSGSPGPDMFDNVHPNLTGYNKMADKWKADLISSGTLPSCP